MSRIVTIRNLKIGSGNKIAVQSMTNLPVTNVEGTLQQIKRLTDAGCDIVRIAVPDEESAKCFGKVRLQTDVPLVADIHFDASLAVKAIECGADKVRINPGNVSEKDLLQVIDCAKMYGSAIRIGVNSGSVNKSYLTATNGNKSLALVNSLADYVKFFENHGFTNLVLSLKSSDVKETIEINRLASKLGYPLHLGVTEAGLPHQGTIKNAIGIGSLLADGIGDTLRVSLTADPVEEVKAAYDILSALNMSENVQFVSCPKCGRCKIDLENVANQVYQKVCNIHKNIKIAVMGCEVNGPGECADADLGLAGGNGKFVIFKKGVPVRVVEETAAVQEFLKEVELLTNDN